MLQGKNCVFEIKEDIEKLEKRCKFFIRWEIKFAEEKSEQ